jgi:predicted acylesterase/phospholipase RssA
VRTLTFICLLLLVPLAARAEKVALALSGGGARGFAHIGVLQCLEEENLQPDLIIGSSMGAIVGGLYAAGYSAAELKSIALSTDWSSMFLNQPTRRNLFLGKKETISRHILSVRFRGWVPDVPLALSSGQKLSELLFNAVHSAPYQPWTSFDDLRIPFRAAATDLITGQLVVFDHGDLAEALRASSSLPLVFAPYRLDTLLLIDGGVIENIPVDAARAQGADRVIGVDVSSGLDVSGIDMPWELADRVTTIMHRQRNAESCLHTDVLLIPDIGGHKSTDFTDIPQLIEAGYLAAKAHLPELRALLAHSAKTNHSYCFCSRSLCQSFAASVSPAALPPKSYDFRGMNLATDSAIAHMPPGSDGLIKLAHVRRMYVDAGFSLAHVIQLEMTRDSALRSTWEEGRIRRITVEGVHRRRPWTVLSELPLSEGDRFDIRRARRGLNQIYGSDLYDMVTLAVQPTDSGALLTVRAVERPSPQLRFGAGYSIERGGRAFSELLNDNVLNSGARLSLFGKYGERDEELRTSATFDRLPLVTPVDRALGGHFTSDFDVGWKREEYNFYTPDHHDTSFYFFDRCSAELWIGRAFRRWGELAWGAKYESVRGGGILDEPRAYTTSVGLRTVIDTKDRYPFPTSGVFLSARYDYAIKSRSQGRAFNRVTALFDGDVPLTHRLVLRGRGDWAWNDRILPLWAQFPLGGEESLLGLHVAERYGTSRLSFLAEVRYDLISRWLAEAYVSALYTVGAASPQSDPLPVSHDYQHGIGAAFSLSTFVGPLRLTAAELLRSHFGKEQFRVYLNLGHEF